MSPNDAKILIPSPQQLRGLLQCFVFILNRLVHVFNVFFNNSRWYCWLNKQFTVQRKQLIFCYSTILLILSTQHYLVIFSVIKVTQLVRCFAFRMFSLVNHKQTLLRFSHLDVFPCIWTCTHVQYSILNTTLSHITLTLNSKSKMITTTNISTNYTPAKNLKTFKTKATTTKRTSLSSDTIILV